MTSMAFGTAPHPASGHPLPASGGVGPPPPSPRSGVDGAATGGLWGDRAERWTLAAAGLTLIVLRAIALVHNAVDSDETQHLHLAWAWSEGLVQYRDVFDNHAPLLHLLSAPLVALLGERADVVLQMRLAMVPLFLATLLAAFFIARRLYSARTAWWTVAIVAFYPPFFLKSLEYRTDNLWTALSMLAMALFVSRRSVAAGFVLGCAACASLKTLPLVMAVILCAAAMRSAGVLAGWLAGVPPALAFLAPPAALATFFYWRGALQPMLYCVFEFNLLAARPQRHGVLCLLCLVLMTILFVRLWKTGDDRLRDRLRIAYVVTAFFLITQSFWPILSQRDYLAVMPLLAMFLAGEGFDRAGRRVSAPLMAALILIFIASLARYTGGFSDRTRDHIARTQRILDLARRGEWVMDCKGETVFRRRPFYYALESITRTAMASRVIADTIPEQVVGRRCHVVGPDDARYPPRAGAFLRTYFLDVGTVRASGQWVRGDGTFAIAIPGRYVMASERGLARGILDGAPFSRPVMLPAGVHRFVRTTAGERVACLWADAYERGYSPFRGRP